MIATQFKKHFIAGSRQTKTSVHLMTVKQGENESLKDYIKRFNTESQLIPDLQDNVAFTALLVGLKSNKLKFELVHDKVSTFSEAMERAERIIEASEVCKAPVENNKGKRRQEDNYHDNRNRRPRRAESDDEGPKYNADRREIYLDIKHKAILPKPNPMNTPIEQRNKKLWCEYHKECGHTTRSCRELKRALDKLDEEGKLNRYLKSPLNDKQSGASKEVQEAHSSADTNISINVIAGGFGSRGLSNRARKSHLRSLEEPIYDIGTPSSTPKDPLMEDKGAKRKAMDIDEPQHPIMSIYMAESPKQYGRPKPIEEDESIPLGDDPARTMRVGKNLDPQLKKEIIQVKTKPRAREATPRPYPLQRAPSSAPPHRPREQGHPQSPPQRPHIQSQTGNQYKPKTSSIQQLPPPSFAPLSSEPQQDHSSSGPARLSSPSALWRSAPSLP
uniref:Retrotransposon gag domain-containing protein n=1 Tax=Chenopodium quinoa TaxID=63459 RepID=A0A803LXD8_CHEQI